MRCKIDKELVTGEGNPIWDLLALHNTRAWRTYKQGDILQTFMYNVKITNKDSGLPDLSCTSKAKSPITLLYYTTLRELD